MNKTPVPFSGILVLDKPQGFTSHDAVSRLRKLFNTRQIGHTGTLDPLATGVLCVLVGRAVKASEYLVEHDKEYKATFILGKVSETGDTDGTVCDTGAALPSKEEVLAAVANMVGKQMQTPPQTSAIKVGGKKLVDYQREGVTVEVPARPIEIYSAVADRLSECEYSLSLAVSKGTYVRTVITDIGKALGCGAVMSSLRRTSVGAISLEAAHTLEEIEAMDEGERQSLLLPLESAFSTLERVTLEPFFARLCKSGCEIYLKKIKKSIPLGERVALYDGGGFFALGEVRRFDSGDAIKMIKLFSL